MRMVYEQGQATEPLIGPWLDDDNVFDPDTPEWLLALFPEA